jgi:phosphoglycolate phosphatase-like HAD superfamily hydrolase
VERDHRRIDRVFGAVLFDWDGTAVIDRRADASALRALVEQLCARGVQLAVASGTHLGNVDDQLRARPAGPGHLYVSANRGSELWRIGPDGPSLVERRETRAGEDAALDRAAAAAATELAARGLVIGPIERRFNRRKLDLLPGVDWRDPPKAQMAAVLAAALARVEAAGFASLEEVCELTRAAGRRAGIADPRVTTDAKHVELGLTDKTDTSHDVFPLLASLGVPAEDVLVAGDELGPLGGSPGSDSLLRAGDGARATTVSVGVEPGGVPPGVLALHGGPARFLELLADQVARR